MIVTIPTFRCLLAGVWHGSGKIEIAFSKFLLRRDVRKTRPNGDNGVNAVCCRYNEAVKSSQDRQKIDAGMAKRPPMVKSVGKDARRRA
nr:hypothetical protein [uncultured Shinella sp.]